MDHAQRKTGETPLRAGEFPVLIEVAALSDRLQHEGASGPSLRVLDLRFSPSGPTAREKYDADHISGALFVDLERDLSRGQPRGPGGRHPLVSASEFAQVLSRLGISENTDVVVYDDGPGAFAARLWAQLRLHGHRRVSLLDGGLTAWKAAGLPTESLVSQSLASKISPAPLRALTLDASRLVDRERIAKFVAHRGEPGSPLLLDARAPERYRGDVEPLDRVGGHIPGAVNLPFTQLLRSSEDPRWRSPEEVRAILENAGVVAAREQGREVIASCGSGVTACHLLAAFALAGIEGAKFYPGSYSDWVSDPDAEVSRGGEP